MKRPRTLRVAAALTLAAGAALAGSAIAIRRKVRESEARNPPRGAFLEVEGVHLHFVDIGAGEAVVLLHGNGLTLDDWVLAGVVDDAARAYRVVAFDRPGFGYSSRPADRVWTAEAQADVIAAGMQRLGLAHAVVVGHSWGTLVAIALAHRHPRLVRGLVLASGYYHPSVRVDVPLLSPPALPVVGALMRWTVSPWIARLVWRPMLRRLFGPRQVPAYFLQRFPRGLAVRPSQIAASAGASALLIPQSLRAAAVVRKLDLPIALVAGHDDRYVSTGWQSVLLHRRLRRSTLHVVAGAGHMVHHAAPHAVMAAIDAMDAAAAGSGQRSAPVVQPPLAQPTVIARA